MRKTLVLIDFQQIFADPNNSWYIPDIEQAFANAKKLEQEFLQRGDNIIYTQFIPQSDPKGEWIAYYKKYPFALDVSAQKYYELIDKPNNSGIQCLRSHKFSKWDVLKPYIDESMYICGVASGCCVMLTILAAIDDGIKVYFMKDASAGSSIEAHQRTLDLLKRFEPMVEII